MHINYVKLLTREPHFHVGITLGVILILASLIGPLLIPEAYFLSSPHSLTPPSPDHWLGTNDLGQDIFARLLLGGRTSLVLAITTGMGTATLALILGVAAALGRPWLQRFILRILDVLLILPVIILAIILFSYYEPSLPLLILFFTLLLWPSGARVIRTQVLTLKERSHIYSAHCFGASPSYIVMKHIIPDLTPILVVIALQAARRAVFLEAGLALMGIADLTTVSWGTMIRQALDYLYLDLWKWWLFPIGLSLSLLLLSLTLIGNSLETILNPRLRGETHES